MVLFIFLLLITLFHQNQSQISSPGGLNYGFIPFFIQSFLAISSFSPGGEYVVLTFDDGPHTEFTSRILDILKQRNARATFFLHGSGVQGNENLIQRIAHEKSEIAIHGWNHHVLTKIARPQLGIQLRQTFDALKAVTNQPVAVIRPPLGNTNSQLNDYLKQDHHLKVVLWSLDSKDRETNDPETIRKNVMDKVNVGDVVLFHQGTEATVKALPAILDELIAKGFELVTLSEILSFPDDSPHRRLRRLR